MREDIVKTDIEKEFKESFLRYAKLTILDRSLPDITGCKPVHTRILWAMEKAGINSHKPYKKAGLAVGEVIGKYHPHGDSSVYEAMVRLSRDFIMRYPLIDAHGNIGSIDGSEAAAMRYVEMRMTPYAELMLKGYEKDAVPLVPTYAEDGTLEPVILPGLFPNVLVNGNEGIAVSTSCDWVPHNLTEVCNGIVAYVKNPDISTKELMQHIPGPDFPLGGTVVNEKDLYAAYDKGVHSRTIQVQGDYEIKDNQIIFTSIPYGTDTTRIKEQIGRYVDEISEYIEDFNDETYYKTGVRIVFDVVPGVDPKDALAVLFKRTDLQVGVPIRMNMVVGDSFKEHVPLRDVIGYYVAHQLDVIKRVAQSDLDKVAAREHILKGLVVALQDIDNIINIIKSSKNTSDAAETLIKEYEIDDVQARAILDTKLGKLTSMEIEDINKELKDIEKKVKDLNNLVSNKEARKEELISQVIDMRDTYGDERRTKLTNKKKRTIQTGSSAEEVTNDPVTIAYIPHSGNVKTIRDASLVKVQKTLKGAYPIETTMDSLLVVFGDDGQAYKAKVSDVKDTMLNIKSLANVPPSVDVLHVDSVVGSDSFIFSTRAGMVKKTKVSEFNSPRAVIALKLKDDSDRVVAVARGERKFATQYTNHGKFTFPVDDIKPTGRNARGVIGVRLRDNEYVSSADFMNETDEKVYNRRGVSKK